MKLEFGKLIQFSRDNCCILGFRVHTVVSPLSRILSFTGYVQYNSILFSKMLISSRAQVCHQVASMKFIETFSELKVWGEMHLVPKLAYLKCSLWVVFWYLSLHWFHFVSFLWIFVSFIIFLLMKQGGHIPSLLWLKRKKASMEMSQKEFLVPIILNS